MAGKVKRPDAREEIFIEEYLKDLDAQRAALAAGYSASMAASKAYQWVSGSKVKPHVFAAVCAAQKKRSERTEVTQDAVVRELARIAFGSARQVLEWGPDGVTLKSSDELDDASAAMVAEVSESRNSRRVKLHSKVHALELLGRHLGMWKDKMHVSGDGTVPVVVYLPDNGRRGNASDD